MKLANPDILTINAGSSSIKFALYQTGERLEQRLQERRKAVSFLKLLTPDRCQIR